MLNANFSNISAISWREQICIINLDTNKTLRNKTYLSIKQSDYMYKWKKHYKENKSFRTYNYIFVYRLISFKNLKNCVPSDCGRMSKQSCQLWNVCRIICYEFAGSICLARVLKYMVFNITFSYVMLMIKLGLWFMVFSATFNSIAVILMRSALLGGGNRSIRRKPPTCHKLLTNFIT